MTWWQMSVAVIGLFVVLAVAIVTVLNITWIIQERRDGKR